MLNMNLREWSNLSVSDRQTWLNTKSKRDLTALLGMIGEMLMQADDMDAELAALTEPSEDVINARNFTYHTLRDVEQHVAIAILNKREQLFEQTV
jgi:hypothetical protein